MSFECKAIGRASADDVAQLPIVITRRAPRFDDVLVKILYSGVCHSDIHTARQEWGPLRFPSVVGHEIVGIVQEVGSLVSKFKVGDVVGVGVMVDSCRSCEQCKNKLEQYCATGSVDTYNNVFKYPHCAEYTPDKSTYTKGGYSEAIVVQEDFVLRIPEGMDLAAATPLLCAGITTYSPFKTFGLKAGMKLGVVGLGGLGHMGVKLGKAFGAHVTVISRGLSKKETALAMGADAFIDSTNSEEMKANANTLDFIYDTISAVHDYMILINMLRFEGTMVVVGVAPTTAPVRLSSLIGKRKRIVGSLIGGIEETQEMLDFCSKHGVVCDIELISADKVNEAFERTLKADVKYRFVIDMKTL